MEKNIDNIGVYEELQEAVLNVFYLCRKYHIDSFIDIYHSNKDNNVSYSSIDFNIPINNDC